MGKKYRDVITLFWIFLHCLDYLPCSAHAERISHQCETLRQHRGNRTDIELKCRCRKNEDFFLPEDYDYSLVTSFSLDSCREASLYFSSVSEASSLRHLEIRNISLRLNFDLYLSTPALENVQFSRIAHVPRISSATFGRVKAIERLEILETRIGSFEEDFGSLWVGELVLEKTQISRLPRGWSFSGRGRRLRIRSSALERIEDGLELAYFAEAEIADSRVLLTRPGSVLLESRRIRIRDSVFSNATMNFVAFERIRVTDVCADGKSSLRLSSRRIESFRNRLPTGIVYRIHEEGMDKRKKEKGKGKEGMEWEEEEMKKRKEGVEKGKGRMEWEKEGTEKGERRMKWEKGVDKGGKDGIQEGNGNEMVLEKEGMEKGKEEGVMWRKEGLEGEKEGLEGEREGLDWSVGKKEGLEGKREGLDWSEGKKGGLEGKEEFEGEEEKLEGMEGKIQSLEGMVEKKEGIDRIEENFEWDWIEEEVGMGLGLEDILENQANNTVCVAGHCKCPVKKGVGNYSPAGIIPKWGRFYGGFVMVGVVILVVGVR